MKTKRVYILASLALTVAASAQSINVTSTGVGIGKTNPTSTLDVNGVVSIQQKNFGGAAGLKILGNSESNNWPNIAFSLQNKSNADVIASAVTGQITNTNIGAEAMDLVFQTTNNGSLQERFRITSNGKTLNKGNVKIFGTDEAWAENLVLIKSSGWGGLRISRNDPATGNFNGNWALGYNAGTGNDFTLTNSYDGLQYDGIIHASASTRNVGIGTLNPTHKLTVNGTVKSRGYITDTGAWSDYVFAKDYKLPTLTEVEQHIEANGHLPGIPSEKEVLAKGFNLAEMDSKLLAQIEQLTLHMIKHEKAIEALKAENAQLKSELKAAMPARY
jgi:hypothetical protein